MLKLYQNFYIRLMATVVAFGLYTFLLIASFPDQCLLLPFL